MGVRDGEGMWLSLSDASGMLGVHASTLRRWADSGRVPCQRTPGGHRRFNRAQIMPLFASSAIEAPVRQPPAAEEQAWHEQFSAAGQTSAVRELGQRLSGIAVQQLLQTDAEDRHLAEARALGRLYADTSRSAGVPLLTAIEAFLYYRASLMPIVVQSASIDGRSLLHQIRRYDAVMGEVLIGVIEAFDSRT